VIVHTCDLHHTGARQVMARHRLGGADSVLIVAIRGRIRRRWPSAKRRRVAKWWANVGLAVLAVAVLILVALAMRN
jgi:uncharacterized membrane protein